jgi:hypothetical protein
MVMGAGRGWLSHRHSVDDADGYLVADMTDDDLAMLWTGMAIVWLQRAVDVVCK